MPKRKSYTADFKLQVIKYAKENGNRAAGREFSVGETSVREWRKDETELESMNPRKRARRGGKARWPHLEANLVKWILAQRENNRAVSTVAIKAKARLLASEMKLDDFKGGSYNWVYKFMRRNNLSMRARTTVGQRLPDDWEKKLDDFREFVHKEISQHDLSPDDVINMDEVPMVFDIPPTRSVAEVGVKTVAVATTGHERTSFTVVLACTAGGQKLKPMLIFKRATMPREQLPSGVVVTCNKKGWMNTDVMGIWTDKCFRTRQGGFFKKKSLLVFDAMTAHKESSVQKKINAAGAHIAVIPGGLTCKLQPLDVAVNRPFKTFVREEWDRWMSSGSHTYTPAGRQRRATYVEVCKWVITAWGKVKVTTITNGFRKCGIMPSNVPDVGADDSTDGEGDSEASKAEGNDVAIEEERLQRVMDMFQASSDDESFEGFQESDGEEELEDGGY